MTQESKALFQRAQSVIPGGVNSPVRAFRAVGGEPRFIRSACGAYLIGEDGERLLDYIGSWGAAILGHAHPAVVEAAQKAAADGFGFGTPTRLETEMAECLTRLTGMDMVRMVNSGTEAVMSAIRLARGFTGRDKLIKFAGHYHGHGDALLVKAGSGLLTQGVPGSSGVTAGCAKDTLIAQYNDLGSVETLLEENRGQCAAVIVEPVAANMGVALPMADFLPGLRRLCDAHGALLIFDEVITGFRLALGGAQALFGVRADLATFGKIIGGGLPVGAYAGRADIMRCVAPLGSVYQAGTLSGNPVAMAAGLAALQTLENTPTLYDELRLKGERLFGGLAQSGYTVNHIGSIGTLFFTREPVTDLPGAQKSDAGAYARFFQRMLSLGVHLAPSQFEAMFISSAHTDADIEATLEKAKTALEEL